MHTDLTQEENDELENHPIGSILTNIDDTQFELRLGIAKKLCQWFIDNDPNKTDEIKALYKEYPMWKFYCSHDMVKPRRMYGIADSEERSLFMVSAGFAMVMDNFDGVLTSNLISVDRWTEDQIAMIKTTDSAGPIFFDPLGFLIVVKQYAK